MGGEPWRPSPQCPHEIFTNGREPVAFELIHPASPRRAIDWRWRAATCLRDGLIPFHSGWVDPWIEQAIAFQDALDDCNTDPHHPRLAGLDPVLTAAHDLWF